MNDARHSTDKFDNPPTAHTRAACPTVQVSSLFMCQRGCVDKGYCIPQPTTTVDKVLAAMTTCCADTLSQTLDIVNSVLTDETRCV